MKTTTGSREALREMAGTVAVKGRLLIDLLDDIDSLQADYALLVTEHEKTEAELAAVQVQLADVTADYLARHRVATDRYERIAMLKGVLQNLVREWDAWQAGDEPLGDDRLEVLVGAAREALGPSAPPPVYTGSITDSIDVPQAETKGGDNNGG